MLALLHLGLELPVTHAEPLQLGRDGLAERVRRAAASLRKLTRKVPGAAFGIRERLLRGDERIHSCLVRIELGSGGLGSAQELLVAGGAEATARVRDTLELALDLLEPPRLRLEGREKSCAART